MTTLSRDFLEQLASLPSPQEARQQLVQLEIEERNQARLAQVQSDKIQADVELSQELGDFATAKSQSDRRLLDLLARLNKEIQIQQGLTQRANRIKSDTHGPLNRLCWATFLTEKPDFDNRNPEHRAQAEFRISQLKGQALIDRGNSHLMVLSDMPNISGELFDVVLYLSGNVIKR